MNNHLARSLMTPLFVGGLLLILSPAVHQKKSPISEASPSSSRQMTNPQTAPSGTGGSNKPLGNPASTAISSNQIRTASEKNPVTPGRPFVKPGSDHVNYPYQALLAPNDTFYSSQWALPKISAPSAWDMTTGSSTPIIAIIDTGFALSHPDLQNRWWLNSQEMGPTTQEGPAPNCTSRGLALDKSCNNLDNDGDGYASDWRGWDFTADDNNPNAGSTNPSSADAFHGSYVAGIAAATGNNGGGVAGVSWGARIMPLQALDDDGSGYTDSIAAAVLYAVDHGADVINLSLGSSYNDPYLHQVIQDAVDAGVTVVAAAGNTSCDCMLYPANYPEVIGVGASDQSDTLASFSSYGANLDLIAPGVDMCSTYWTPGNPNGYGCGGAGTSFASPLVAGTVSLMLSRDPNLSPKQVSKILAQSSTKVGGMGGLNFTSSYGYGRLNVQQAVAMASLSSPGGQLLNKATAKLSTPGLAIGPSMDSTCTGPAGAVCSIIASNSAGATVTIATKTLDTFGGADFQWSATGQLTSGIWKIQAVVTSSGQTSASNVQILSISN